MRKKGVFRCLWLLCFQLLVIAKAPSQNLSRSYLDSLSYEGLLTEFNQYDGDSINQEAIARAYLNRARREGDSIKMARGYDRLARIFSFKKNLAFADSVIVLTDHMQHKTYPALGYLIKGLEFHLNNDIIESTNNFFKAYDLSINSKNVPQQIFVMHLLIYNKALWGDKRKALKLQHERHSLIESPSYISSLVESTRKGAEIDINQLLINDLILSYGSYFFCYSQINKLDSAEYYLNKCKIQVENYNWVGKSRHQNFVKEAEVELAFKRKKFSEAKYLAEQLLQTKEDSISPSSRLNLYYILGASNINLDNNEEGIKNLNIADSIYEFNNVHIQPNHRDIFLLLSEYHANQSNLALQINVLNKLIQIDSISKSYFKHFEPSMYEYFDTPRLLNKKELLISQLEAQDLISRKKILSFIILLLISLIVSVYYVNRQLIYKKRFDALILKIDNEKNGVQNKNTYNLSTEIVSEILEKLNNFEIQKEYLVPAISLQNLAKNFETNANYLSRVINLKLGKNFSQYINDLRIDYAMNEILEDTRMRKYTIKAIAEECGYKNAESFSKAFYKRNKIYPSYYIKKLEKKES